MTPPRTRRKPQEQAHDILVALIKQQEAKLHRNEVKQAELGAVWKIEKAVFDRMQLALLKLEEEPSPSETPAPAAEERIVYVPRPMVEWGTGDDLRSPNTAGSLMLDVPDAVNHIADTSKMVDSVHRQRIGEKAANGTPKCPSCGGANGWHYDECTICPKKVTP